MSAKKVCVVCRSSAPYARVYCASGISMGMLECVLLRAILLSVRLLGLITLKCPVALNKDALTSMSLPISALTVLSADARRAT